MAKYVKTLDWVAGGLIDQANLPTEGNPDLSTDITGTLGIANGGTANTTAGPAHDALTVQGADVASATTTNIGAATGHYIHVTGTTTITAFDTVAAGRARIVEFTGILTLTHNATTLILPTGANITTAAGDCAVFVSEGSGNWRCVSYQRKDGTALVGSTPGAGSVTLAMLANIADQTILGNNTGGAAAPVALTASQTKTVLGATTAGNAVFTLTNPSAVSWIRINADNTATARTTAQAVQDLLDATGSPSQGDIIYFDGTDWTHLAAGTNGQFLKTSGTLANISWAGSSDMISFLGTANDAAAMAALGGTTVGIAYFTLSNPSAVTFPRMNADNTLSALSASDFRTAIGAGTGDGTVTSVATAGLATGGAITSTGTVTVTAAVQSDMETGTSTTTAVTPAVVKYNAGVCKAWCRYNGATNTNVASLNISSVTDNGTGDFTYNHSTSYSSATAYTELATGSTDAATYHVFGEIDNATAPTAGACRVKYFYPGSGYVDAAICTYASFGDQ